MTATPLPDLSDLFAHVDTNREAFLQRLIDYVAMPSISAHGLGIGEVAEFLVKQLAALGLEAEALSTSGWPMVYGCSPEISGAPTVLFYGHYDVQPPDPLEEWLSPPFEPTIRDGRIYARGVGDNKGQHFAQILAIESTLACRDKLPCNVIVLLEGEEEVGSPHMREFAEQYKEKLKADLVIVADGPQHASRRPVVSFGARGVASFELHAKGANRDLHSGGFGGVSPNPIWTLVHLLSTMKNEQGEITIAGFYDNVHPPTALEQAAMAALPLETETVMAELDLTQLDKPLVRPFFERTMFWPTFTVNGIHGGYGGPGSKTVLPCEVMAKCDMRLVEGQRLDEIRAKVEAHIARHAPNVELVWQGGMEPSKTSLDSPFAAPLQAAVAAGQGEEPLLVPSSGGSLPNYVFTSDLGIPTFTIPYANPDEANHAPNENMEVERFYAGIKTGIALLAYLAGM